MGNGSIIAIMTVTPIVVFVWLTIFGKVVSHSYEPKWEFYAFIQKPLCNTWTAELLCAFPGYRGRSIWMLTYPNTVSGGYKVWKSNSLWLLT